MQQDYYHLLGVRRDASPDEIKRAYRALIQQYHPDRHVQDRAKLVIAEEMAKQINMAYQILSDPRARRKYDHDLRYGANYAAANQSHVEIMMPAPNAATPVRPQFRWQTEPPPMTLNRDTRRWLVGFVVVFICCSLVPLLGIIASGGESTRFTPTPQPTITITVTP